MEPVVDVTIAVHTATRPIARAVSSILDHNSTPTRVTVVAHNIGPEIIARNLGEWASDDRVRLLELADGVHSPAGPMNFGLSQSTAPFVAVMGSDDEFEPGAIDSWYSLQQSTNAGFVIAQVRHAGGGKELSPPARPFRSKRLHPVKDRLSYRSAPLGLISRSTFGELRFVEGLLSGEDLPYVAALWFSGAQVAFARSGPGYLVHDDAGDRVTAIVRPIADDFAFLDNILGAAEFHELSQAERHAYAVKLIRSHIFDAVVNRAALEEWADGERNALAVITRRIIDWGGHPERVLSLIDRAVLDGVLDATTPSEAMMNLIRRRWNYRSADVILTKNPLYLLHRQGPLRTYVGGYFI